MQTALKIHFDRLEALKDEAARYFAAYPEDALNAPPQPGKWGALQHMAHIVSSETKGLGYMTKKIQGVNAAGSVGVKENFMAFLLRSFLRTGIKFKAPAVLDEPAAYYTREELFGAWAQLRTQYTKFLENLEPGVVHKLIYKHPIAGRLSPEQALAFMVIHLERHLKAAKKGLEK